MSHRLLPFLIFLFSLNVHAQTELPAAEKAFPLNAKKILFMGDSITHAGHYISMIEEQLLVQSNEPIPEFINLGLPSETCSGLSEPDHPFPRPDVHERLTRALEKIHPDVVVACYGMNDGIYYPFSEERFLKYQQGIRSIIQKVDATGAKLILMTPPAFDPLPLKKQGKLLPLGAEKYAWFSIYEDYDSVLKRYAAWIMTLQADVDMVIDLHTPVLEYVSNQRKTNPDFTMSPDGVHVNEEGHSVLAKVIIKAWGIDSANVQDQRLTSLVHQKQMLMHNSMLSEVGHLRPGVKPGLPVNEAKAKAKELDTQIQDRLTRLRPLLDDSLGKIHHHFYPASTEEGELSLDVDYYLWLPPNVDQVRGIIVHQHGCGDGASKGGATAANDLHWRELAKKWDCALLGSSFEARKGVECRVWCDARRGSADRFVQALKDFADQTGHPEVAEAPWCLWGHSGGGFWASIMQALYPEKIVGIWLQSGQAYSRWTTGEIPPLEAPQLAYQVPVVACPGGKEKGHERFHVAWDGCLAMFQEYRKQNAPIIFAPDPITGHECGDSRYLAIPFFDLCLQYRLPKTGTGKLRPFNMDRGVYANLDGDLIPQGEGTEDAVWLPGKEFAKKWQEFIRTGSVSDSTPPPVPEDISIHKSADGTTHIRWSVVADYESGIAGFRISQGKRLLAQLPEKPVRRFGRPIFQMMSYHDTPEQPLPLMEAKLSGEILTSDSIKITAVNSVGLESAAAVVETN